MRGILLDRYFDTLFGYAAFIIQYILFSFAFVISNQDLLPLLLQQVFHLAQDIGLDKSLNSVEGSRF